MSLAIPCQPAAAGGDNDALSDLGDAPDSTNTWGVPMTAYQYGMPPWVRANFPTVYKTDSAFPGPIHWEPQGFAHLGASVSLENEADVGPDQDPSNNLLPKEDTADKDGMDDGVVGPLVLTHGESNQFKYIVTVDQALRSPLYANVWFDWNRDGDWDDVVRMLDGTVVPEWAVRNQQLLYGAPGSYTEQTPQFLAWHPVDVVEPVPLWMRITLAERPWMRELPLGLGEGGSGTAAGYQFGETEDYCLRDYRQAKLDFGDAPDGDFVAGYPTFRMYNGARHQIVDGLHLGQLIDAEPDGQSSGDALGDDNHPDPTLDDEDGVFFRTPLVPGQVAQVDVIASAAGLLNAWIDFNTNISWGDAGDQIFTDTALTPGVNSLSFMVPTTAKPDIATYARFRFSTEGRLSYTGFAPNGEVEDYQVKIGHSPKSDLGDAPDSTNAYGAPMTAYPGIRSNFPTTYQTPGPFVGPLHLDPRAAAFLGRAVTLEDEADSGPDEDGSNNIRPQPDTSNLDGADDGVAMPIVLLHGQPNQFQYTVTVIDPTAPMYVNVWFDWDRNGDWDGNVPSSAGSVPEWAVQNQRLQFNAPGVYTVTTPEFMAWRPPAGQATDALWMRITLAEVPWQPSLLTVIGGGGSGPADGYRFGETEDYLVAIQPAPTADLGDAPDSSNSFPGATMTAYPGVEAHFPTTYAAGQPYAGPLHRQPETFILLGNGVTRENEADRGLDEDGNGLNNLDPPSDLANCDGQDDGVQGPLTLTHGEQNTLDFSVTVNNMLYRSAMVNVWFDWNRDGDWDDVMHLPDGTAVPEWAVQNQQFQVTGTGTKDVVSQPFYAWHPGGLNDRQPVWMRITVAERTWERPSGGGEVGWGGAAPNASYRYGETEDYYVTQYDQGRFDYGDAPDRLTTTDPSRYPTLRVHNGARHAQDLHDHLPLMLGRELDFEPDGQPNADATGDDLSVIMIDDEDGVSFASSIVVGGIAKVDVVASAPGLLDGWLDFGRDGDWAQNADRIFASLPLTAGVNHLSFPVSATAVVGGTFARFRLSSAGGLSFDGPAPDGEVEDYMVKIEPRPELPDLGDAPDSTNSTNARMTAYPPGGPVGVEAHFPTVYRNGSPFYGPIHLRPKNVAFLGTRVTGEEDADVGFDEDGINNIIPPLNTPDRDQGDDGVLLPIQLVHGQRTTFKFTVTVVAPIDHPLYVNAWFDWNRDGDWDDAMHLPDGAAVPEWAVQDYIPQFSAPGAYTFTTPAFYAWQESATSQGIWMRITLAEQPWQPVAIPMVGFGGAGPVQGYQFGETEDYYIKPYSPALDFGDAPVGNVVGYPTLECQDGARHVVVASGPILGRAIDSEPDGQPSYDALGDDLNPMGAVDDEDGIVFGSLVSGETGTVQVTASADGYLYGWVDFDANWSWAESNDQVFAGVHVTAGTQTLTFHVPENLPARTTYARFRLTGSSPADRPLAYVGLASDGEVEDYQVKIEQSAWDFGDAPEPMYPTLLAHNGARHRVKPGFYLGASIDSEANGQPTLMANGDDNHGMDDENGILAATSLVPGCPASFTIAASASGRLDAWIDFNGSGSWDASEQIANALPLASGPNTFTFTVPPTARAGATFARLRLSSVGGLPVDGPAPDGEVEDYRFQIQRAKWVQPPQPSTVAPDSYTGWDETSIYGSQQIVADDWVCTSRRPVSDVHWWGAFRGWRLPNAQEVLPQAFHVGIWTDVSPSADDSGGHPGTMIWEAFCPINEVNVQFIGWDLDPRNPNTPSMAKFAFDCQLPRSEWFRQPPGNHVYWVSISAVYLTDALVQYPFGWETRPRTATSTVLDDAVRIFVPTAPTPGSDYQKGEAIEWPEGRSWDMSFALTSSPRVWIGASPASPAGWITDANWVDDALPIEGDSLEFPDAADNKSHQNDFPAGAVFGGIVLSGGGYTIVKQPLALDDGITNALTAAGDNALEFAIRLDGPQTVANHSTAYAYCDRGMALGAGGRDYNKAIADFNEAIRLDPKYAEAYFGRGSAWEHKGEGVKAVADFTEAIRLDPTLVAAYCARGGVHYRCGEQDKAIEDFSAALRLEPRDALAYYGRGRSWGMKGDRQKAIADFTQTIRLGPGFAEAYRDRGIVHSQAGDYARAIADCTEAIRLKPRLPTALFCRGDAYSQTGDLDAAIADYNQALQLDPRYAAAYRNREGVYVRKGDLDAAIADYTEAIRLNPRLRQPYLGRGAAYSGKGEHARAEEDFARAKKLEYKGR